MTTNFDRQKYGMLLAETIPQAIRNNEDLDRAESIVTSLLNKGENISPEEEKLLDIVSDLIEVYEDEHYPIPEPKRHDTLRFLMEDRGLKQKDLLPIFGSSGIASEVVRGKRSISKAQAKKLAAFFNVSVEIFI
jgi:HTH-type transcriptional regulator / antitoxin HigA